MNTYNQSKRLVEYFAVVGLDPAETPVEVKHKICVNV